MMIIKNGTTIQSLQIGMSILDLVATQGKPMKFTDIQELTGITKSNLYKYLNTLTYLGILYRDPSSGLYVLGSKLIEYGMTAVNQENVLDRIDHYLYEINKELQETVLFSSWTNNGPMVVKVISNNQTLNIGAQIGTYLPLLSSTGKTCAAFLESHVFAEWKEENLKGKTAAQIEDLEAEIEAVRRDKLAFSNEPLVPSVSSIAFPILNYKGQFLGNITIVGFSEFLSKRNDPEKLNYIKEKMKEISALFGYNPQQQHQL
jgi:DNA-binding IclR family transcriptional regulator